MEPWSTNEDRLFVTTPEEVHRSDETPPSTSDLLALRATAQLLHRVSEPADRQEARAPSTTMGPTLPSAQPAATHTRAGAAWH